VRLMVKASRMRRIAASSPGARWARMAAALR